MALWRRWRKDLIAALVGAVLTFVSLVAAFQWYCLIKEARSREQTRQELESRRRETPPEFLGLLKEGAP